VKGWKGLNWLGGYPWAGVPVCLAITLAAWVGAGWLPKKSALRSGLFLLLAWLVLLACFEIARASLFALHSSWVPLYLPDRLMQGSLPDRLHEHILLLGVPLAVLLASAGIFLFVRLFLLRISWWTLLFLVLGLILIMPASLVTCHLLSAFDYRTDYFHAVKMGYPAFWAVVFVGVAVMLGRKITKEMK
jgi:hypothetical protein